MFILSIPKLANVAGILFLLIFLYAVLGMSLLAKTKEDGLGVHVENANFRTFYRSCITLIRCMTGENWNGLMHSFAKNKEWYNKFGMTCVEYMVITSENYKEYDPDGKGTIEHPIECGNPWIAYTYFITFTASVSFLVLNLFIAVILEGFAEEEDEEDSILDIREIADTWKELDPDLKMRVSLTTAVEFVDSCCAHSDELKIQKRVPEKKELRRTNTVEETAEKEAAKNHATFMGLKVKKARIMDLTVDSTGLVTFLTCLLAVLRSKAITTDRDLFEIEQMTTKTKLEKKIEPGLNLLQTLAVTKLQKRYKARLAQRKAQKQLDIRRKSIRESRPLTFSTLN